MVDLHTHSLHSDGKETPTELVLRAKRANLTAFAVTDHDTVAGVGEAFEAGKALGVNVISGVELTTDFHGGHIHILGYGLDIHNSELLGALKLRSQQRRENFYEKVEIANKRLKVVGKGALDADELLKHIKGSPGRPHIAYAIVEQGWARTFREAFDAYLLGYAPKTAAFGVEEGIGLIHAAGGSAVLAHPGSSEIGLRRFAKSEQEEREAFKELMAAGLDGVEAYTPAHIIRKPPLKSPPLKGGDEGDVSMIGYYLNFAKELNLIITGGTDWHGPFFDAPAPGAFAVPDKILHALARKF